MHNSRGFGNVASKVFLTPGLIERMETLGSNRAVFIIPEGESYPLSKVVTATGLRTFLDGMSESIA